MSGPHRLQLAVATVLVKGRRKQKSPAQTPLERQHQLEKAATKQDDGVEVFVAGPGHRRSWGLSVGGVLCGPRGCRHS